MHVAFLYFLHADHVHSSCTAKTVCPGEETLVLGNTEKAKLFENNGNNNNNNHNNNNHKHKHKRN